MLIGALSVYEKLNDPSGPTAAETLVSALANAITQVEQAVRSKTNLRLERIEQALATLVQVAQRQEVREDAPLRGVVLSFSDDFQP